MEKNNDEKILLQIKKQMDIRGVESLSDEQLLSLIIKEGDDSRDVMKVSSAILERFSLDEISDLPKKHVLEKVKGLTDDALTMICACKELYNRINGSHVTARSLINAADVYDLMRNEMIHYKKEYFRAIAVNNKLQIMGIDDVSIGSIDSASAHPREVFRSAIALGAYGIFLVHNHPSDNPIPSISDMNATQKIRESGEIIGINLIDHIIVTSKGYYSFNTNQTVLVPKQTEINKKYSQMKKSVL